MRERLAALVAPALLVVVACAQIGLAFGAGLSPWKGGGFGMFASTDHSGFRLLRAAALDASGEHPIPFPPHLAPDRRLARELPTAGRLRALGEALAAEVPTAHAVRVTVWRTVFDQEDLRPELELLASVTVAGEGVAP